MYVGIDKDLREHSLRAFMDVKKQLEPCLDMQHGTEKVKNLITLPPYEQKLSYKLC